MRSSSTKILAITAIAAGVVLLGGAGVIASSSRPANDTAPAATVAPAGPTRAERAVNQARDRLREYPRDAQAWAQLGAAYVEQARATADPGYYGKAHDALQRSLTLAPEGNGPALIGMGALANAKHEFSAARDWALRAQAVLPDDAQVYGVLADALTQLGEYAAATEAVQRMLDLRPSFASFTRASYEFELHGQLDEARQAMERALADTNSPDLVAFCHYHLGELAFNSGRLDEAQRHYDAAAPNEALSWHGQAKVAAARGNLEAALDLYRQLVDTTPAPDRHYYAELLTVAGRASEADAQYEALVEQLRLVPDDLEASVVAASRGDGQSALRLARAEWDRRRHVEVADALAWALHLNGQHAEALTYADRAAELGSVSAAFAYHRGMILRALGQTEQAAEALATALRINPYFSPVDAPLARAALAELRAGR